MPPTKKPKTLEVPLEQLTESDLNPRRTVDEAALAELAESLRSNGVLQTLLVRPIKLVNDLEMKGSYEVVCGARRLRAAHLAGLTDVPVRVRYDLDDDTDALEAMITENAQRADVPPLQESDAYQALRDRGRDVAAIAAKLGRTESYVRARLRLQKLGSEGRLLLERELLTLTAALALAQLGEEAQREAIEDMGRRLRWPPVEVMPDGFDGDRYSVPAVARVAHVHNAVASTRRVLGAQTDLFGEEGDDLCLDGECWSAKAEAFWGLWREGIEAAGGKVLEGDAAKAVLGYGAHRRVPARARDARPRPATHRDRTARPRGGDRGRGRPPRPRPVLPGLWRPGRQAVPSGSLERRNARRAAHARPTGPAGVRGVHLDG